MVLEAAVSSASYVQFITHLNNQECTIICSTTLKEESIGTKPGYCTKAWKPALFSNIAIFWTVPKAEKTCIIQSLSSSQHGSIWMFPNCFSQTYHHKIQIIRELITRQTLPHWFTLQDQVWKHIQCVRHRWSQHTAYSQLTPATHYSPVLFSFHQVRYQTVPIQTSRN